MSDTATSPLELWNRSRRIAGISYRVAHGNTSFDDVANEPMFPFTSEAELTALVNGIDEESRSDVIDSLQRIIHERLKSTVPTTVGGGAYDNSDVIREWNAARSAATALLSWADESEGSPSSYTDVRDEHGPMVPVGPSHAEALIAGLESEQYNDQHMELTRALNERAHDEEPKAGHESGDSVAGAIAEDLIALFIDRELSDYRTVAASYDDVEFPARDVVMMEVVNSTGDTREERKAEVREWVATWCDDPEAAAELNSYRPRPMGMSSHDQ